MRYLFFLTLVSCFPFITGFVPKHKAFERGAENCLRQQLGVESSPFSLARCMAGDTNLAPAPPRENVAMQTAEVLAPTYDLPIVINDKVIHWLEYFQGRGRRHFVRWLSRFYQYESMIRQTLREHDLPEDLIFLAMIESGFQPYAYSRARAVGMWQFMRRTGSRYGLRVNWWVDERRDPFKATLAAARHMRDLYAEFGDWYLVAAGYNAGSGKVNRAIRRYKTRDFWELIKGRYLRPETRNYVPKLIAAAIIAKNPAKYGFHGIQYKSKVRFDTVVLKHMTDLRKVARLSKTSLKTLKNLNPELRRPYSPPKVASYTLRVPIGKKAAIERHLKASRAELKQDFLVHRVRRGESLWTIARAYNTSLTALQDLNAIRNPRYIRPGKRLMIPTGLQKKTRSYKRVAYKKQLQPKSFDKAARRYRVKSGDTLWSIARRFDVTVSELKRWNRLGRSSRILVGDVLQILERTPKV